MHSPLILVADPDTGRSAGICAAFSGSYACIRVANAGEALRAVRERRPDLVVLDFPFPVEKGKCLSAAIHEDPDTAGIPVVAYSGWDFARTRAKAEKLGCRAFVAHDEGPEAVLAAVRAILKDHQHAVA